jgi:hypothetical protein
MPPRLSKPTDVPDGHQPLIDMLWRFYVAADGPSTRKVAQVIASQEDDQRDGTANHETVRRTLKAVYLPELQTVEVIFQALCQIANIDPGDDDDSDDYERWEPSRTHRDHLRNLYRFARYGAVAGPPRTRTEKARQEAAAEERRRRQNTAPADPWDEPPF